VIDRSPPDVTRILRRLQGGEPKAMEELMPIVYGELRRMAQRQLARSTGKQGLQTTTLVHEAFLKLAGSSSQGWNDRCHFFAVAATAMRQILVDQARQRGAYKRGGDWERVDFEKVDLSVEDQGQLLLDIDDALGRLSELSPRLTRVVECRFFADMTMEETATALGITERTVRRDWVKARAWLHRELGHADA
jgi:RNA polymerase sigma factor (TIGR02999 family)